MPGNPQTLPFLNAIQRVKALSVGEPRFVSAPAANLPTAAQLTGLLDSLADPSVPFTTPVTQNVTFVNQGGWMLSRSSAMALLQAAAGH